MVVLLSTNVNNKQNNTIMIRHKWIIGVRNKLITLWGECDSCAAIEGACMTESEREKMKDLLEKAVRYIDKQLPKPKK